MFRANNRSISSRHLVKQASRGLQPQSVCTICGNIVVDTRGGVCFDCAMKAERLAVCRKQRGIATRIVRGQPACVLPGGEVVHEGTGCGGCRFE